MGPLIVLVMRLLVPVTILKWPFWGGVASLIADYYDFSILNHFYPGGFGEYQRLDKLLDTYYLCFELYAVYRWTNIKARKTGLVLFLYRIMGVTLFIFTNVQQILFAFPNLFEMYFLAYSGFLTFFKKEPDLAKKWLRAILAGLFIYKIALEFTLHVSDFHLWPILIKAGGQ